MKSCVVWHFDTKSFFKTLHHWNSAVGRSKVDFINFIRISRVILWVVFDLGRTCYCLHHMTEKLLSERHKIIVIAVGPVKLTSCEFWIMGKIDTLVSELFSYFVDTIETTNDKLFEIELWGNSHIKLHVKVVMESFKRTSSCTTWDHVHHWSFNFNEIVRVQEIT